MKILINRTDALGDTILTMPMAKLIKSQFPQAEVYFLVAPRSFDLFTEYPYVDGVWVWDKNHSWWKNFSSLSKKIKEAKIDTYFYVGGDQLPSLIAFLYGIPFRGGLLSKTKSFLLLNQGVRQKRSLVEMHESEYNLNLLRPLNLTYQKKMRREFAPQLYLSESEVESARLDLLQAFESENLQLQKDYLVIHPGMTGHTLNWPVRNFARFIIQLDEKFPQKFSYVISYTPSDERFLRPLKAELNLYSSSQADILRRVCFFDGSKKGLRNYLGILSGAKIFLGPSTGTTHMAAALGVPVVSVYSPIKVQSMLRWGPVERSDQGSGNKKVQIVVPDVICGETFHCAGKKCPYFECMEKVDVSKVIALAQQVWRDEAALVSPSAP